MISNLNELKARINIVDIIGSFVPLRKFGNLYKCPCPFHAEKTPSFVVNERKNMFHCFGCKEGGDAFSFVQKFKGLEFNEASELIADISGFTLEYSKNENYKTSKKDYFAFYEDLNDLCLKNLAQNEKVKNYLYNRGLDEKDFKDFDIGLFSDNNALCDFLSARNYTQMALDLGFLVQSKTGGFYAPFASRISFAFRNLSFKIVGFSCRIHPYHNFNNKSKYINSRESFLFSKSAFLYNLVRARNHFKTEQQRTDDEKLDDEINSLSSVIIVEGFMDCVALHKLGYKNVIASCGTAFNKTHLAQILKLEPNIKIKLCFDNDEAGKRAKFAACELLFLNAFFESKVCEFYGLLNDDIKEFKDIGEILEAQARCKNLALKIKEFNAYEWYIKEKLKECESARAKDIFIKSLVASARSQNNIYTKAFCFETLKKLFKRDFSQNTHNLKLQYNKENANLKAFFKSILENELYLSLAKEYLNPESLGIYTKSYKKFAYENVLDDEAKALLFDENLQSLSEEAFRKELLNLLRIFYEKELDKAILEKNVNLILELKKTLALIVK